jgi:hypothetical protein
MGLRLRGYNIVKISQCKWGRGLNGEDKMKLELITGDGIVNVAADGELDGQLHYILRRGNQYLKPEAVRHDADKVIDVAFRDAMLRDEIGVELGLIRVKRTWKILKPGRWQLMFDYVPGPELPGWLVPAVMYQRNERGEGRFPRGGIERGWSFREDRIPVPSCSILHNDKQWQAVFTGPSAEAGEVSSVKTLIMDGRPAFEIRVPFTEEPFTYTEKGIALGGLTAKTERFFIVRRVPFEYSRTFYIAGGAFEHTSDIYTSLWATAIREFARADTGPAKRDWAEIAGLKFHHLKYLLIDNPSITAIKQGRGNGLFQSFYEYTAGSFLSKSLEAAVIFARMAGESGNEEYECIAERIGEFFLQGALANGLHRDCYSLKSKHWGGYMGVGTPKELGEGANARCNGEVMVNYLRLYRLLKEAGIQKDEFLHVAENNASFYIHHQLQGIEEGSFGRWWNTDGSPLNTLGTNGAYIISLLVELEKVTGKRDDIDISLKKAGKYYASLIDNNGFYADTLDADCVDKEAGCALLRAFMDLYERSHDEFYLKYASLAAGFVLSWMFTYNVAFDPKSMVGKRGFRTQGMTAVSVAHHHLDFYGLFIAYDFLRLWEATGDGFWKKCALLMTDACRQLISSEKDLMGKGRDFTGWQPEQVNQTNWDYKLRYLGTKGRFHTCVAWTVVLTLGAMLDIRERFPDVLGFALNKYRH